MSADSLSSSPAPTPEPSHPVLVSLHMALEAVQHLEGCVCSPPSPDNAPHASRSAAALFSSPLLAGEYERDWEVLTKELCLLVDYTHPDHKQQTPVTMDAVVDEGDGRVVLLRWNASSGQQQGQQHCGDVTRLFVFLHRLAEALWRATFAPLPGVAASSRASTVDTCVSAVKPLAKTKAQLKTEDLLEPVLIYGCAVASNLASYAAERKRSSLHASWHGDVGGSTAAPSREKNDAAQSTMELYNAVWLFVIAVVRLYRLEKRLLHLLLSVLSNVVSWHTLTIDAESCKLLYQLIAPFYTSSAMVNAWVTMLCNLTAVHGAVAVPTLLRLGVVADVERLSLAVPPSESATTERLVVRAVQLLSNVAMFVFQDEKAGKANDVMA